MFYMKNLIILEQPQNDEILEWNVNTGRYQLTLQYVKSLRDVLPYRTDRMAQQRIKQTSLRVYNYIVNHSNSANRPVIDFLLNKTENGRKFLIEVLTSQMEADMEYGYNDLMVRPALNSATNQMLDRDEIRLNSISLETEEIINDSVGYFGFNLCVLMPYNWYLFDLARKYED